MSNAADLETVLREALDARAAEIHTAIPGKVVNYNAELQVADIQPLVKDLYHSESGAMLTRSFPVLPSVPVAYLRGGGYFLSVPLDVGDTGMLVFSELPIDRWRSTGQESHPVNARRHGVGNAVFYPGVRPRADALDEDGVDTHMVLGREGGAQVHVKADEVNLYEENAADFVALAAKVETELQRVKGDIAALVALLVGPSVPPVGPPPAGMWVPVPMDGGAALRIAAAAALAMVPSNPASTAATKVKAT